MLERTAATLESCTTLHALPSATHSLRSHRKLHTGFWQHGAAPIDIHSPVLSVHCNEPYSSAAPEPSSSSSPSSTSASHEGLVASTFLLDFLYPSGAAALLRRLAHGINDRQPSSIQRLPRRSRLFTSSAVAAAATTPESPQSDASDAPPRSNNPQTPVDTNTKGTLRARLRESERNDSEADNELRRDIEEDGVDDIKADGFAVIREADVMNTTKTHSGPSFAGYGSRPDLMRDLMAVKQTEYFGSIWQLYSQLEPQLQPAFCPEVIVYLYRSANLLDARRIILLFSQLERSQWTPAVLSSVVNANLRLGNEREALQLYHTGLDEQTMVGGLDDLLQYGFRKVEWDFVRHVWASYHVIFKTHGIKCGNLDRLAAVPNLGNLAIQFAKEIETRFTENPENTEEVDTINILKKKVARRALRQPCKPNEALPLLRIVDQVKWYNIYLCEAIQRGQKDCLPEIYRIYRAFPDTKPYWAILHGMFEIFYPHDIEGLEQVYEDYHTSYQGLDRWGFRKFLKFYASRGDIKSVERLWNQYVQSYQHRKVLQEPETFNHLLNAYANNGDPEGARRVFDEMRDRYGVTPSLYSWNILLKSHVRSKSYNGAMGLFHELCEATAPDQTSFATLMSLTGRSGDLTMTSGLLEKAAEKNVVINVPMLEAMVHAYCQNKKFSHALATCVNAKKQLVPGNQTLLWNALLFYHSERRAFNELCRVLKIMSEMGIEWTSTTHNVLLQALVRCKQTHHAYDLLRKALRDKSFDITPEHFATVMDGGLRTREYGLVTATERMRLRNATARSVDALIRLVEAMIRRQIYSTLPTEEDAGKALLASSLQQMIETIDESNAPDSVLSASLRSADSLHRLRRVLPRAITLFSRYRDFRLVKELFRLQTDFGLVPASQSSDDLPLNMLFALLKENVEDQSWEKAKETWKLIWQHALRLGRPETQKDPMNGKVMQRHAVMLSAPVNTIAKMYLDQKDPDGFKKLVDSVLSAGFTFGRQTMNAICQTLAKLGYWAEACEYCEKYLMPGFSGWQMKRIRNRHKKNLPLEQRRIGSAPQWLRPTSYTIVVLAEEYMEIKAMMPWSSAAAEMIHIATDKFPRVVAAIDTITYTGIGIEVDVFGDKKLSTGQDISQTENAARENAQEGIRQLTSPGASNSEEDGFAKRFEDRI
ncbi:translation regulator [Colletotrichum kahawae]|uniref:Translation regulator n=1 Tax=Colletotrichum kahawae TaxID=34407 RepID=A0AAD9YRM4_COLKA|nr:translation regulator [Colletotrichum kahawae]